MGPRIACVLKLKLSHVLFQLRYGVAVHESFDVFKNRANFFWIKTTRRNNARVNKPGSIYRNAFDEVIYGRKCGARLSNWFRR